MAIEVKCAFQSDLGLVESLRCCRVGSDRLKQKLVALLLLTPDRDRLRLLLVIVGEVGGCESWWRSHLVESVAIDALEFPQLLPFLYWGSLGVGGGAGGVGGNVSGDRVGGDR